MTELEHKAEVSEELFRDTSKTTKEHEKWIHKLVDNTKANLTLIGASKNSKDGKNVIKNLFTEITNFPYMKKDFNIHINVACGTQNSHD